MKSSYSNQTISSLQKTQGDQPTGYLRSKVKHLTFQIEQLKQNQQNEDSIIDNLEKTSIQNFSYINENIQGLKKAFNNLADVMMEELENIKGEFNQQVTYPLTEKIIEMEQNMHDISQRDQLQQQQIQQFQQSMSDSFKQHHQSLQSQQSPSKLESTYKNLIQENSIITKRLLDSQEENKNLQDKIKDVMTNNKHRIDIILKDKQAVQNNVGNLMERVKIFTPPPPPPFFNENQNISLIQVEELERNKNMQEKKLESIINDLDSQKSMKIQDLKSENIKNPELENELLDIQKKFTTLSLQFDILDEKQMKMEMNFNNLDSLNREKIERLTQNQSQIHIFFKDTQEKIRQEHTQNVKKIQDGQLKYMQEIDSFKICIQQTKQEMENLFQQKILEQRRQYIFSSSPNKYNINNNISQQNIPHNLSHNQSNTQQLSQQQLVQQQQFVSRSNQKYQSNFM